MRKTRLGSRKTPGVGARGVGGEDDGSVGAPALMVGGLVGWLGVRYLFLLMLLPFPDDL